MSTIESTTASAWSRWTEPAAAAAVSDSATSVGRAALARWRSVTMLRVTVSSQPRTEPSPFTITSGWRQARISVSWTTSSAAWRSPVSRVA